MEVIKSYIPFGQLGNKKKIRRPGYRRVPTGIIVHSTANPRSNAMNERNWLVNPINLLAASWNVAIDGYRAVIAIPIDEVSNGTLSRDSNRNDIQIEICESGDREATLRNAINYIASLCIEYKIPIEKVRKHADVQIKNCPRILIDTGRWEWFVSEVKKRLDELAPYDIIKFMTDTGIQFDKSYWGKALKGSEPIPASWVATILTRLGKELSPQ